MTATTETVPSRRPGWLTRRVRAYAFARSNRILFPWRWARLYADNF